MRRSLRRMFFRPEGRNILVNGMFNPIKCSCDSINQLLFFTLILFYGSWCNIFHYTLISFYNRDGTFSTLISFYCRDATFSTLISFYCRDQTFSTLISFYYRDVTFSTTRDGRQSLAPVDINRDFKIRDATAVRRDGCKTRQEVNFQRGDILRMLKPLSWCHSRPQSPSFLVTW